MASRIDLQLPTVFFLKAIISDMHHRITYMYINFNQIRVSRSVKTVHTNILANNRKLHKLDYFRHATSYNVARCKLISAKSSYH